jgi:hypothetical protein
MLDAHPAVRDLCTSDPLAPTLYGLPLSVKDYRQFVSVGFDRASVRPWTNDGGSLTVDNSGDLAKTMGLWPDAALLPVSLPPATVPYSSQATGGQQPAVDGQLWQDAPAVIDALAQPTATDGDAPPDTPETAELSPATDTQQGQ